MLFGLITLLVLLATFFARRIGDPEVAVVHAERRPQWLLILSCGLVVLAGNVTALDLMPLFREHLMVQGDARTHAYVIAELARAGLGTGWLDAYQGGFPVGHHYPPLGWLIASALVSLGVDSLKATMLVGGASVILAPLVVFGFALRFGVRPLHACLGALVMSLIAPFNGFVGGMDAFFVMGLFAQCVGTLLATVLAGLVLTSKRASSSLLVAALAMAAHPQVSLAFLGVLGIVALVSGSVRVRANAVGAGLGALIGGAALYGQGMATLAPPFGWPDFASWKRVGFGTRRLGDWLLDGELLDLNREPWLSSLILGAVLVLVLFWKNSNARLGLCALFATLVLSCAGPLLDSNTITRVILEFAQPLRALGVVPVVVSVVLMLALEVSEPALLKLGARLIGFGAGSRFFGSGIAAAWLLPCLLDTWVRYAPVRSELSSVTRNAPCGAATPSAFTAVKGALAKVAGARLWVPLSIGSKCRCAGTAGFEMPSPAHLAASGAIGAHVGVLWRAYHAFAPAAANSWVEADALGVGFVLTCDVLSDPHYKMLAGDADFGLYEVQPKPSVLGVGCVSGEWSGPTALLRDKVMATLASSRASVLLDSTRLVRLRFPAAALQETPVPRSTCHLEGASTRVFSQRPGEIIGEVSTSSSVVVVAHVSAFLSWKVAVDGKPALWFQVAPGFVAVEVGPGRHRLEFRGGTLPGYGISLGAGCALLAGLVFLEQHSRSRRGLLELARPCLRATDASDQ